ncbi:MAG: hypothetical protein EOO77_15175 [Oxalobacteraceae bacterium]|nr:MAG: hypothetical protein EOO77_15175 [Oxalobacteraceae bacterium]
MTCHFHDPITVIPQQSRQPIYPYTVNPCPEVGCTFTILPMNALVFPFWLCPGVQVHINVQHLARVQDKSLRAWISHEPIGLSVTQQTYNVSFWEPNRTDRMVIALYDRDTPAPKGVTSSIPADPGVFYLNVHNLVNSSNQFGLRLTQCGCADKT